MARRPATAQRTYGYHRVAILVALVNAASLVVIALAILWEACKRLRAPVPFRDLPLDVCAPHPGCHRALELRPGTVVELLERVNAFRRPDRFEEFLQACECDFRGRPGYEDRPFPASGFLRQALQAALSINAGEVARNADPAQIREALVQARTAAVASWRDRLPKDKPSAQ